MVSLSCKQRENRSRSCELGRLSFASQESGTGTAPTHTMTQFGITLADDEGNYATWGEQVTDEEYNRVDSSKI